jgi:hypothetical protein
MPNIIYILTNEAMPGLVKIGFTDGSVEDRIRSLASTSVPLPFECYYAAEVDDMERVEKLLHQLFSEHRVNPKREFFRIDPEKAVLALSIGKFKEVTPGEVVVEDEEEKAALEKEKARQTPLKLSAIGISEGATLTFSRDPNQTATVVGNNKVDLNGETLSLSAAALKVLHQMGYKTPAASGPGYWMYDGEMLCDRRNRLEAKQFNEDSSDE